MILSLKMKSFFSSYLGCVLKLYIMDRGCSEVSQTSSSYSGRRTPVPPSCVSQERGARALIMCRAQIISIGGGCMCVCARVPRVLVASQGAVLAVDHRLLFPLSCYKRGPALLRRHRLTSSATLSPKYIRVHDKEAKKEASSSRSSYPKIIHLITFLTPLLHRANQSEWVQSSCKGGGNVKLKLKNVQRLEGKMLPKMRLVVTPYDQCAVTPRKETRLCADAQLETIQVLPWHRYACRSRAFIPT